jgi:FkbM family methyltransferase
LFNFILTRAKNVLPDEKLAAARQLVLQNCDFIIDIGANNGQWITDVKDRGYKGQALCIEPLKKNYVKLKSSNFHNTSTLNCAVGNSNGYIYINNASNDGLSSSILELDNYHKNAAPSVEFISKEKVKIRKLSRILEGNINQKIFVKIDTQGYEYEVLLGTINSLKYISIIQLELSLINLYENQKKWIDIISFLQKKNFKVIKFLEGFEDKKINEILQIDCVLIRKN